MLTLDETTLFYYSLNISSKSQDIQVAGVIKGWAAGVKPGRSSKPSSTPANRLRPSKRKLSDVGGNCDENISSDKDETRGEEREIKCGVSTTRRRDEP